MIRQAKEEDLTQVRELAEKHKLPLPAEGNLIVAVTVSGKVEAFANIRPVFTIEPFVCENSLAGKKLWDYIENRTRKSSIKILRCFIEQKNEKLLKKLGFYRIFKKSLTMEINFYQGG